MVGGGGSKGFDEKASSSGEKGDRQNKHRSNGMQPAANGQVGGSIPGHQPF